MLIKEVEEERESSVRLRSEMEEFSRQAKCACEECVTRRSREGGARVERRET